MASEDLLAIPERTLREQSDFGEGVEDHSLRVHPLDFLEDASNGLSELDLGRVKHRRVFGFSQRFFAYQLLINLNAVERWTITNNSFDFLAHGVLNQSHFT